MTFVHSISPGAITASDSSLFSINFIAIGDVGAASTIEIVGDPVKILITDDAFVSQTVVSQPGLVTIEMTSPIGEVENIGFEVGAHWPNPFNQILQIPIWTSNSTWVQLKVFNLLGQEVLLRKTLLHIGQNVITIESKELLDSGHYFFQLDGPDSSISRPFILVR